MCFGIWTSEGGCDACEDEAALECERDARPVVRAVGLADDRVETKEEALEDELAADDPGVGEGGCAEGLFADVTEHEEVDDAHRHQRELGDGDRDREASQDREFAA